MNSALEIKHEFKAAKTVAVVVGLFYISWLPFIIGRIINLTDGKQSVIAYYINELGGIVLFMYINLVWCIYGASNKEFRNAYVKVLKPLKFVCFQKSPNV